MAIDDRGNFSFKRGLIGDMGTTATVLILVFILTIVLGGTLFLLFMMGEPMIIIGAMISLVLVPAVIIVGMFTNTLLPRMAASHVGGLLSPFARVEVPPREFQDSYRRRYIGQKMTTFSISVGVFIMVLIVASVILMFSFSIGPLCGICLLPISFPLILITLTMPAIAWLSIGYAFDPYEPEPRGYLVLALLWGMLSTFPSLFLNEANSIWMEGANLDVSLFSAPIVEESFKCLGFILIISQISDETDGVLYGILFGSGFALIENFLYSINAILDSGGIGFFFLVGFRSFFNVAIHIVGPVLVGFSIGFVRAHFVPRVRTGRKGMLHTSDLIVPFVAIPMLLLGMFNHLVWNFLAGLGGLFFVLLLMIGMVEFAGLIMLVLLGFFLATNRMDRIRTRR